MLLIAGVLSLLVPTGVQGQNGQVEFSLTEGYMTPNNFNMPEYAVGTMGCDVAYWSFVDGDEWWKHRRANMAYGLKASFAYIPSGVAGHRLGLEGLIRASLADRVDYHLGAGVSYYTLSSYITGDRSNIFITTLISCLIDVGLDYRVTDEVSFSLALLHSSNGMLNRPNKGLNYLQAGVSYSLGESNLLVKGRRPEAPAIESRHEVGFAVQGGAVMSRDWNLDGYYPCYDLSLNYQYYVDPVFAVGATLDLWYNFSHLRQAQLYGESYRVPAYLSALGYVEGFWGNVSIKAGAGPVLVAPKRVSIRLYERVGVYYNVKRSYFGIALNAHAGMIEFIELCYGYRIKIKRGRS